MLRRGGFIGRACLAGFLLVLGCDDGGGKTEVIDTGAGGGPGLDDAELPDTGPADAAPDTAVTDSGPDAGPDAGPACPPNSGFGLLGEPAPVTAGDLGHYTPRVVWTGTEAAAMWFEAGDGATPGHMQFRRFNAQGEPQGDAVVLGRAALPKHELLWTGTRYVAIWMSAQTEDPSPSGLVIQTLSAEGVAAGPATLVPQSFDTNAMAAGWAPLAGGMLLYTRGQSGSGGLFAIPLDEGAQPGAAVSLSATRALAPAVTFGNGVWGAAWLDPSGATPNSVQFRLLNEQGRPNATVVTLPDVNAQGNLQLAYGMDVFGVAWSAGNDQGQLIPRLTLLGSDGSELATIDVRGPSGYGLVTDVSWLDPNYFAVAWQDRTANGARVGLTRIQSSGQELDPYAVEPVAPAEATGLTVAGTNSNVFGLYTLDPTPLPNGYSPMTQILLGRLGPCRP